MPYSKFILVFSLYFFTGLIFILALASERRAFCHTVCWMAPFMVIGTKIRNLFRWPALHLRANKDKCKNCLDCTKVCVMSLDVNGMVQKGSMVNSESCGDSCPEGVIRYSFRKGKMKFL